MLGVSLGVGLLRAASLATLPTMGVPVDVPTAAAVNLLSRWMLAAGVQVLCRGA